MKILSVVFALLAFVVGCIECVRIVSVGQADGGVYSTVMLMMLTFVFLFLALLCQRIDGLEKRLLTLETQAKT